MTRRAQIGDVVHSYGKEINGQTCAPGHGPEAAIVVGLYEDPRRVDLFIIQSNGTFYQRNVEFSEAPGKPYSWSWKPVIVYQDDMGL